MASFKPVTATLRGLEVLAAVNRLGEASVGQIHKLIGLNLPTIVRMLETLQHAGYVGKHPDRAVYYATGRTLELSYGFALHRELTAVAGPILAELARETGWPSDLAVFDGQSMLVVQTSRGEGQLFFNRRPGYRAPLLATSLGRAYLATCRPAERAAALKLVAGAPEPWNEVARRPELAKALFEEIRAKGYATMHEDYSDREYAGRFWAVGTAVAVDGETVAALNMMILREVASSAAGPGRFVDPLRRAAARIGAAVSEARRRQPSA